MPSMSETARGPCGQKRVSERAEKKVRTGVDWPVEAMGRTVFFTLGEREATGGF